LKTTLELFFPTFRFLNNITENLELTLVEIENFLSMLHPLMSQLCRVILSEGGFERRIAPCTIFTVAQEVEDHVDDLCSSRLIDIASFEDGYHFEKFLDLQKLVVN
jgi:hypothetical protein